MRSLWTPRSPTTFGLSGTSSSAAAPISAFFSSISLLHVTHYVHIHTYMDPMDCVCYRLRRAARATSRAYDEALAPVGLRSTQLGLLGLLHARGALPLSELAEALVMERTTLTRNLKPLERDKLVASAPGQDRRQRIVRLTTRGEKKLAEALPLWRKIHAWQSERLGPRRKERLMRDLRFVADAPED